MNKETSETGIFLIIFTALAFIILKQWLLETFITIWRVPMIAILYPLIYIPKWITEHGLFFWMSHIPETALNYVEILMKSPEYIVNKYEGKGFVSTVNAFVTNLFAPYLVLIITNYILKINALRTDKYKKSHSIDSLVKEQADTWPQIKPMVNVHPEKISDLDEGEWAMCLEPKKFAEVNDLLIKYENRLGEDRIKMDKIKAAEVFTKQLGRPWVGIDDLTQEEKFIFAILITKASREGKEATRIAKVIASAYTTETHYSKKELKKFMDVAIKEANEKIKKHGYTENIQNVIKQHFFVNTVFPRLLEEARVDGVFTTADFIWLKPRNRSLWYILNNVGRRAAWTEVSGTWYHFNYEKTIKRKIPSPLIEGAIKALDEEFKNSSYEYDPLPMYNKIQ